MLKLIATASVVVAYERYSKVHDFSVCTSARGRVFQKCLDKDTYKFVGKEKCYHLHGSITKDMPPSCQKIRLMSRCNGKKFRYKSHKKLLKHYDLSPLQAKPMLYDTFAIITCKEGYENKTNKPMGVKCHGPEIELAEKKNLMNPAFVCEKKETFSPWSKCRPDGERTRTCLDCPDEVIERQNCEFEVPVLYHRQTPKRRNLCRHQIDDKEQMKVRAGNMKLALEICLADLPDRENKLLIRKSKKLDLSLIVDPTYYCYWNGVDKINKMERRRSWGICNEVELHEAILN